MSLYFGDKELPPALAGFILGEISKLSTLKDI